MVVLKYFRFGGVMGKRKKCLLILGVFLFLVSCTLSPAISTVQIPTQATTVNAPLPLVVYITATPFIPIDTLSGQNPTPVQPYSTPTPIPTNASIIVTRVDDLGNGRALVHWTSVGDFPSGFMVIWSSTNQGPIYPADQNASAGDPSSRSALINTSIGSINYLRVCRYVNHGCDVYSNLAVFELLNGATSTQYYAAATATTNGQGTAYNSSGGVISSSSSITITNVSDAGSGKARITWNATGTFANGFAIVYSQSSATPYVGGYPYYVVSNNSTRIAYVDGTPGVKYYYRICRISGTTCDIYSNSFSFTYPGTAPTGVSGTTTNTPVIPTSTPVTPTSTPVTPTSTPGTPGTPTDTPVTPTDTPVTPSSTPDPATISITSITDTGVGTATIDWDVTGDFPDGFIILLSKGNNPPTISDTTVPVTDGNVHTATITGDAGSAYFIRICKLFGSTCSVYSNVSTFTFANYITLTSLTETSEANAHLEWTADGNFPAGFLWLASANTTEPVIGDPDTSFGVVDGGGSARSADFTLTAGITYYFRVCQAASATECLVYSNVLSYDFSSSLVLTGSATGGDVTLNWTGPTGYSNFTEIKVMGGLITDSLPTNLATLDKSITTYSYTVDTGSYAYYLCAYDSAASVCRGYSNFLYLDVTSP
jgi:hypothetical protein